jgi:hypothetical protein
MVAMAFLLRREPFPLPRNRLSSSGDRIFFT